MFAVAPISSVESRIGAIQQRITPGSSLAGGGFEGVYEAAISQPVSTAGFDPFGAAYQQAVQKAATATAPSATTAFSAYRLDGMSTGSSLGQIGGYGSMSVPAELAQYGNGRVPAAALEPIGQGSHRLYAPAAASWRDAVAAARADGIDLRITDSYRSYEQQVDLVARKGLYSEGGLGATPGTSNHGWGLAVDVDVSDSSTLAWMRANGHRFGFVEAVPREPWHWEFRPQQA
ncbi:MAG: D-alanyl-D-alanine carboxypeptidase family protein [Ilumatobacteraceae bacterium]